MSDVESVLHWGGLTKNKLGDHSLGYLGDNLGYPGPTDDSENKLYLYVYTCITKTTHLEISIILS